jgi:tetratricopeptide (TPR) repeat protein
MLTEPAADARNGWADWKGWPYLLIGLAVVLRVAHILNSRSNPTFWAPAVDPAWYDKTALDIVQGNWGPFPLFRAPLYPALLAAVYTVFGHDLVAARMLNVVLQGATVWVIWRAGRSYFSAAVGVLAGLLFALNGMAIYFSAELVSPSLEMFTASLATWATFWLFRDRSRVSVFVCGLAWGLAAITRPNFLFILPITVVAVAYASTDGQNPWASWKAHGRKIILGLATLAAGVAIPILPITAANWILGGEPVLIATQGGVNFWIGNNPESTGILSVLPGYGNIWTMEDAQEEAEIELGRPVKSGELSAFYYRKAWDYLLSRPADGLRLMISKTFLFFNRFEISNNKHIAYYSALSPWLPPLEYLDFGVLLPLALMGLWALWRYPTVKVMAGLTALYAISIILFFITSRFRMPTVPWLCLLAAAGLMWAVNGLRSRLPIKSLLPVAILIPGAFVAWMNPWHISEAGLGWAKYMEANAYLKLNQLDSARVGFEEAIRDNQGVARAQLNLGVIAFKQGKTEDARNWYEQSLKTDPGNPDAWNNLGTVYESLHDTAQAMQSYQRALLLKSSAPDPRHNLAGIYFRRGVAALKQGQDSVAAFNLERCIELEPTPVGHYNLAIALGRSGHNAEAILEVERALNLDPRFAAAAQLRAKLMANSTGSPVDEPAP